MVKLADMLGINKNEIASADMVCGYTCPMADKCKSMADRKTGKIIDSPTCKFRCYGASLECAFTPVRNLHWDNFDTLRNAKTVGKMTDILLNAISSKIKVMRIHSFGDFFNQNYFSAWLNVTEKLSDISFFAYTKVLPFMKIARPANFAMVYSYGGLMDSLVADEPIAYVVDSVAQAEKLGVPLACHDNPADDYNYVKAGKSFALVIHGTQPAKK
jgi:hypothetical protein